MKNQPIGTSNAKQNANQVFWLDSVPVTGTVGQYNAPYVSRTGRLHIEYSNGSVAYCSGTIVNSPNRSVVATAKHCLNSGGAYAVGGYFVPGYDRKFNPAYMNGFYGLDGYIAGTTDTAFFKLGGRWSQNWSWLGTKAENDFGAVSVGAFGYSAANQSMMNITGNPKNNGNTEMMLSCHGGISTTLHPGSYGKRCNGGPGMSGSAFIYLGYWRAALSTVAADAIPSTLGGTISDVRHVYAPSVLSFDDSIAYNSIGTW